MNILSWQFRIYPTADMKIENRTVKGNLFVDTITKRLANEAIVDCNLVVGSTLLVDTIDTS